MKYSPRVNKYCPHSQARSGNIFPPSVACKNRKTVHGTGVTDIGNVQFMHRFCCCIVYSINRIYGTISAKHGDTIDLNWRVAQFMLLNYTVIDYSIRMTVISVSIQCLVLSQKTVSFCNYSVPHHYHVSQPNPRCRRRIMWLYYNRCIFKNIVKLTIGQISTDGALVIPIFRDCANLYDLNYSGGFILEYTNMTIETTYPQCHIDSSFLNSNTLLSYPGNMIFILKYIPSNL